MTGWGSGTGQYSWLMVGFLLLSAEAQSQDLLLQWEPEFSYTQKLGSRWEANAKASFQQSLPPPAEDELSRQYRWDHAQVQGFVSYRWRTNISLSGGYTFRINEPAESLDSHNHRLMEQIGFVSQTGARRWAHRIRLEQRFQDQGYVNRGRYRLSLDIPLNGQQVNPGEKYLIASNEWLFSFDSQRQESQNRLYLGVGWYANSGRKTEVGAQYRLGGIGAEPLRHTLWLTTAFYWN